MEKSSEPPMSMTHRQKSIFDGCDQELSPSEVHAKTSAWQGGVKDLLESDQVFSSDAWNSVLRAKPNGWSGRTCLEFSQVSTERTLPASLSRLQAIALQSRRMDGATQESVSGNSIPVHGLCWTRNGSEFRSGAGVCSLSQVLESGAVPTKYFLSPKACRGILRRAEKRGRELPERLRRALTAAAMMEDSEQSRGST